MLCIPLTFTFLLSSVGLVANSSAVSSPLNAGKESALLPPALFTLYLLTMLWPKVQEFILKMQFIFVYIAPWQIS
jgi:hypothetical protein